MLAPEKFALWMSSNTHVDAYGEYRYHPRSDAHSKQLCLYVLEDLLENCGLIRRQAAEGDLVYGINKELTSISGKKKTLDLAIGTPEGDAPQGAEPIAMGEISRLLFSCEAKSCMTEHGKSKPRLYDELSSSHEIVHQGWPEAIATGISVVNIAAEFVSPLRQREGQPLQVTLHKQPAAAGGMIEHLRGLKFRDGVGGVGFEAYSTIVIDCDNQGPATLWADPPAPQPGDLDDYRTFLERVCGSWEERFSDLDQG